MKRVDVEVDFELRFGIVALGEDDMEDDMEPSKLENGGFGTVRNIECTQLHCERFAPPCL